MDFQGSQISIYYDGVQLTNLTDATYTAGGISVDMWTDPANYVLSIDDVVVDLISSRRWQTMTATIPSSARR